MTKKELLEFAVQITVAAVSGSPADTGEQIAEILQTTFDKLVEIDKNTEMR